MRHGKGGKLRRVSVTGSLSAALAAWRVEADGQLVIGSRQTAAWEWLRRLCARTGVTYRGWHALRHYAGTRVAAHLGLETAAQHLGHASIETTRIYAKWADTSLKDALKGW